MEYMRNALVRYPDYFMLFVFVMTSFVLVSIGDVLVNIPKDNFSSTFNFFVIALRNTSWIIQVLIAGFLIRIIVAGSRLTYKNFKNSNINADWIMAKFRY
jgi:hypothetical protein